MPDKQICPKCNRPVNIGNSPNSNECTETDDDAGLCEAYAQIHRLTLDNSQSQKALATMITIVSNMPLGYQTEEEHKKLEDFADRCLNKMRETITQYKNKIQEEDVIEQYTRADTTRTTDFQPTYHAHDIWCNVSRKRPVGCPGCSCTVKRKELNRLRRLKAALEDHEILFSFADLGAYAFDVAIKYNKLLHDAMINPNK